MTLKEKIDNNIWTSSSTEVADDFAIGFAYYLLDKNDKPNGEFTIKKLCYERNKI